MTSPILTSPSAPTHVWLAPALGGRTSPLKRIVTVTGPGVVKPANLVVPVGTMLSDVLDFCGGLTVGVQPDPGRVDLFRPRGLRTTTTCGSS